jgi:hypothetical protein
MLCQSYNDPLNYTGNSLRYRSDGFQGYVSRNAADGFPMLSTPFNFYTRIPHIPAALGTATIKKQEVLPQLF